MDGVTVIICCYNSADRLEETVGFLFSQRVPSELKWEIVIVNNASGDNTLNVAQSLFEKAKQRGVMLTVVEEPKPGLSNAREKGIETAAFDLLVFCDDDNHLDEMYISLAINLMREKPEVGIAGGWVKPKFIAYPGNWIEGCYSALAIGKQADASGYVDWVFGAGMIFRKSIFNDLKNRGIALLLSGRNGSKQTSGDDGEMCQLARFIGYRIYYSSELMLDHKISPHRLTRWSFIKGNFKNVYPVVYFYLLHSLINEKGKQTLKLYISFWLTRSQNIVHFFPRIFFGKYRFYSFLMLYQNIQLLAWLCIRRGTFAEMYQVIKANLYK